MLRGNFVFFKVQTNCQGQGYTLATRDDGQPICYFYMNEVDDDLDYDQSKQMCADKGTSKFEILIIESCVAIYR